MFASHRLVLLDHCSHCSQDILKMEIRFPSISSEVKMTHINHVFCVFVVVVVFVVVFFSVCLRGNQMVLFLKANRMFLVFSGGFWVMLAVVEVTKLLSIALINYF